MQVVVLLFLPSLICVLNLDHTCVIFSVRGDCIIADDIFGAGDCQWFFYSSD